MAIRLEYSTTAKCRPDHIWEKFKTIEQWAWWNRVVGQARWVEGEPWQKGSRFLLELAKPKRWKLKPVILESSAPNKVGWVGKGSGVTGEHWFTFEQQPDGTTLMKTWEDFSGPGTLFFGNGMREQVVEAYAAWFEALKFEAERLAREEKARS